MRLSTACIVCRQRKVKCVHLGEPPCNHCRNIGNNANCILYTTKEYLQIRGPNNRKRSRNIEFNKLGLEKSINFALQHYPELFFLNFYISTGKVGQIHSLLTLSIDTLVSLFDKTLTEEKKAELYNTLEAQFMSTLENNSSNSLLIMQCSIILLIINWQKGKTYKGYLVGGIAERAYKTLFNQNMEDFPILEKEAYLRTIWSYQLITLSLREESIQVVKSRLHKFRLPLDNIHSSSKLDESPIYINSINGGGNYNLTSLLIMSSEVWIDCLSWLVKGGKYYFKEAPWDPDSEWNKLERKIFSFHDGLGINESFSYNNLISSFIKNQGNLYCSVHLTLMISEILLHREFIPFIPNDGSGATGPFDKLQWLDNAPPLWWQQSASKVFETAKNVSIILDVSKHNGKYSCNTFNGFIALTAASILSYIKHFPHYDVHFKDAEIYYGYCTEYLLYYKSCLGIGSYYYKILMQTNKIFDLAIKEGVSSLVITLFEQLKHEVLDIANVSGPVNSYCERKVEKLFHLEKNKSPENYKPARFNGEEQRKELSSLMNWDFDWMSLENFPDMWNSFIEDSGFQ